MGIKEDYENHEEIKIKKNLYDFRTALGDLVGKSKLSPNIISHLLVSSGVALTMTYSPNDYEAGLHIQTAINSGCEIHKHLKRSHTEQSKQ